MVDAEHRVGLAATEVGLQLDHRLTTETVEALQGDAQQVFEALSDEGAPEELDRVGVFGAADAAMHQIEIGGELGLLVTAVDHVRVGSDHIPPRDQARLDLVFNRSLIARLVSRSFCKDDLLQLLP